MISGQSACIRSLNDMVSELARTDIPILVIGESGTGKEVYARLIHRTSALGEAPLERVNCVDSEAGRVLVRIHESLRTARGEGKLRPQTLFLDGVDELDPVCQRILLSLISNSEPRNGSGVRAIRLISSMSRDLEIEVDTGGFRRELYFRINGVTLRLPPLRERKEDIPVLLDYFLTKYASEMKKPVPVLDGDILEALAGYKWPGNIRELENVAKKMVALGDPTLVFSDRLVASAEPSSGKVRLVSPLKLASRAASRRTEREIILQALHRTGWNRKRAASQLRISYKSLLYKIKQIGVQDSAAERL
jgi:two-component system response regulator AtoC